MPDATGPEKKDEGTDTARIKRDNASSKSEPKKRAPLVDDSGDDASSKETVAVRPAVEPEVIESKAKGEYTAQGFKRVDAEQQVARYNGRSKTGYVVAAALALALGTAIGFSGGQAYDRTQRKDLEAQVKRYEADTRTMTATIEQDRETLATAQSEAKASKLEYEQNKSARLVEIAGLRGELTEANRKLSETKDPASESRISQLEAYLEQRTRERDGAHATAQEQTTTYQTEKAAHEETKVTLAKANTRNDELEKELATYRTSAQAQKKQETQKEEQPKPTQQKAITLDDILARRVTDERVREAQKYAPSFTSAEAQIGYEELMATVEMHAYKGSLHKAGGEIRVLYDALEREAPGEMESVRIRMEETIRKYEHAQQPQKPQSKRRKVS